MDQPYYPVNDFGPVMKGLIIGGLGTIHVFIAQFAVGAGILMCYFQWLSQTGQCAPARAFLGSYFRFLVLIAFVIGALTGVGMWFTAIQISARTIGTMVHEFHWIWASEWTFFCLEIVSGYAFYRCADRLSDRHRFTLLVLYAVAAWMSLLLINGILSWQLTPGDWPTTHRVWDGFFNPSFWPSLFYRTVASMTIASLMACVVINTLALPLEDRRELIHRAASLLVFMVLMPVLGIWYFRVIPADSRSWLLGGSAAMTLFTVATVGASLLIGLYALVGLILKRLSVNIATAALLCALALAATGGGEFIREGSRKPYSIRQTLYSNSISPASVAHLRRVGSVTFDPYPLRNADEFANEQLRLGAKVFRFQCSVCHTIEGINGLVHLTGTWTLDQKRMNIAKLQHTKPFMPPFSGNAEELEALAQTLTWQSAGRPGNWTPSLAQDTRARIQAWLDEAGVSPVRSRPAG